MWFCVLANKSSFQEAITIDGQIDELDDSGDAWTIYQLKPIMSIIKPSTYIHFQQLCEIQ